MRRFLCFIGAHPAYRYKPPADYRPMVGGIRTCVACGRAYRDTYDGMEQRWVRVR